MSTANGLLQISIYLGALIILAKPLGNYMAKVYVGKPCCLDFLKPLERGIYRFCGIDPEQEMSWQFYALSLLIFNFLGIVFIYLLQCYQHFLPFNPQRLAAVSSKLALNTAISFVTNTNWQAYSGEKTLSYLVQTLGLTVQNFVSAATGLAVMVAIIRGLIRHELKSIGNFWVDLIRGTIYVLLPLAMILALLLVSQGVVQNFHAYQKAKLTQSFSIAKQSSPNVLEIIPSKTKLSEVVKGKKWQQEITEQILPMGPAASQVAIKHLGTNGGGFFSTNSAHPFENPTPLSNFLEMLALLLIPAACCFTFGSMIADKKQGVALFLAMTLIFLPFLYMSITAEQHGNPLLEKFNIDQTVHEKMYFAAPGGNMEGKETRFGIINSGIFATATTAAANGATNAAFDSFTPLGGLVPLVLMQLGELVYGGVGSGFYDMLIFVIMTVFIAGLMVGRSPEYLGKKIEIFEMKMAALVILITHASILILTAIAVSAKAGIFSIANPGMHGFSEILYAFTSTVMNNGSAFAGLNANTNFYNLFCGLAMFLSRFAVILAVLALAGSLAQKKIIPVNQGTMPTHNALFIALIMLVIVLFGALTFFPALSLGPIAEHLTMIGH